MDQLEWQGGPGGQESVAKQRAHIQTFIDKGYDAILVCHEGIQAAGLHLSVCKFYRDDSLSTGRGSDD